MLVDKSGNIQDQIVYDSFGNIKSETGTGDRFKFTAREWDSEISLYNYRARSYSPSTGRFVRQDPIGFAAGDTNLYRYGGNGVVNGADPLGTFYPLMILGGAIIGGVVGGAIGYYTGQGILAGAAGGALAGATTAALGPLIAPFTFGYTFLAGGLASAIGSGLGNATTQLWNIYISGTQAQFNWYQVLGAAALGGVMGTFLYNPTPLWGNTYVTSYAPSGTTATLPGNWAVIGKPNPFNYLQSMTWLKWPPYPPWNPASGSIPVSMLKPPPVPLVPGFLQPAASFISNVAHGIPGHWIYPAMYQQQGEFRLQQARQRPSGGIVQVGASFWLPGTLYGIWREHGCTIGTMLSC
jgi:RHS repeat-associated protein